MKPTRNGRESELSIGYRRLDPEFVRHNVGVEFSADQRIAKPEEKRWRARSNSSHSCWSAWPSSAWATLPRRPRGFDADHHTWLRGDRRLRGEQFKRDQDLTVGYYEPDPAPHQGFAADGSDYAGAVSPEPSSLALIGLVGGALITVDSGAKKHRAIVIKKMRGLEFAPPDRVRPGLLPGSRKNQWSCRRIRVGPKAEVVRDRTRPCCCVEK